MKSVKTNKDKIKNIQHLKMFREHILCIGCGNFQYTPMKPLIPHSVEDGLLAFHLIEIHQPDCKYGELNGMQHTIVRKVSDVDEIV